MTHAYRANCLLRSLDESHVCAECGAPAEVQMWEIALTAAAAPGTSVTVRRCSADVLHRHVVPVEPPRQRRGES